MPASAELAGVRVLIIDDNATNREIIEHQTAAWKMINASVGSGPEGLEALHSARKNGQSFDLVILDMHMPGMDGLEVAQQIKADSLLSDVQIIMLTSIGLHGDAKKARASGIVAYLTKPVRKLDLYSSLLTVMSLDTQNEDPQLVTRHSIAEERKQLHISVLVAEDNITNQDVIMLMLQTFGCNVDIAQNGREAVAAVTEKSYDLIFMDCQMPQMDGYLATSEIRHMEKKEGHHNHIPIIALTGNALEGDREKCLAAGMDDYLSKPINMRVLQTKIEAWSYGKHFTSAKDLSIKKEKDGTVEIEQSQGGHPEKETEPDSSPIDQSVLNRLKDLQMEGKPDIFERIITAYCTSSEPLVAGLREALAGHELNVLQNTAHSLKSSSANVGAVKLSLLNQELEKGCRDAALDDGENLVSAIEAEYIRVKDALTREIHSS